MRWDRYIRGVLGCVGVLLLAACASDNSSTGEPDEKPTTTIAATSMQHTPRASGTIQATPEAASGSEVSDAIDSELLTEHQVVFDEKCIPPNPEDGYTNYEQTLEGMYCARSQLGWPADRIPDDSDLKDLILSLPDAEDAGFERGWAYMTVAGVHSCQWSLTWIDAYVDRDEELRQVAEYWLVEVGPDYQNVVPDYPADLMVTGRDSDLALARSVQAGDVNAVRQEVTNCLDFKKDQGHVPMWYERFDVDLRRVVR